MPICRLRFPRDGECATAHPIDNAHSPTGCAPERSEVTTVDVLAGVVAVALIIAAVYLGLRSS